MRGTAVVSDGQAGDVQTGHEPTRKALELRQLGVVRNAAQLRPKPTVDAHGASSATHVGSTLGHDFRAGAEPT